MLLRYRSRKNIFKNLCFDFDGAACSSTDVSGDFKVNLKELAKMALQWLKREYTR